MVKTLVLVACLVVIYSHTSSALTPNLKCYSCSHVLNSCLVGDATLEKCGAQPSACARQIKRNEKNELMAIRKCVTAASDAALQATCPSDQICHFCDKEACNSASLLDTSRVAYATVFALILAKFVC